MNKKLILWIMGWFMIGAVSIVLTVTLIEVLEWALAPFLEMEWRALVETVTSIGLSFWAGGVLGRFITRKVASIA